MAHTVCRSQKWQKKKLDMVIIDFAAIAYLFPYHDN